MPMTVETTCRGQKTRRLIMPDTASTMARRTIFSSLPLLSPHHRLEPASAPAQQLDSKGPVRLRRDLLPRRHRPVTGYQYRCLVSRLSCFSALVRSIWLTWKLSRCCWLFFLSSCTHDSRTFECRWTTDRVVNDNDVTKSRCPLKRAAKQMLIPPALFWSTYLCLKGSTR